MDLRVIAQDEVTEVLKSIYDKEFGDLWDPYRSAAHLVCSIPTEEAPALWPNISICVCTSFFLRENPGLGGDLTSLLWMSKSGQIHHKEVDRFKGSSEEPYSSYACTRIRGIRLNEENLIVGLSGGNGYLSHAIPIKDILQDTVPESTPA